MKKLESQAAFNQILCKNGLHKGMIEAKSLIQ
jgi:hypothetical protein